MNETPGQSGKVIEVRSVDSRPPSSMALRLDRSSSFWTSNFPRIKDWKQPADMEPIQVINFSAKLVGDKAQVIISVFKGKRFGETTEQIATLLLAEGDIATVSGLAKYGYLPLTVAMVAVATQIANVPLVTNPAQSLKTVVTPTISTLPSFNVKLINESPKAILAISWHTEGDGRRLLSSIAQGKHSTSLIETNGEYEITIRANNPDPSRSFTTLVLDAVIYNDLTYDGNADEAATFLSFNEGRRKALAQIVPILNSMDASSTQRAHISKLIERIDSVSDSLPRSGEEKGWPSTPEGVAFGAVVKDLLKALRKIDATSASTTDSEIRQSLRELSGLYQTWLERLSK